MFRCNTLDDCSIGFWHPRHLTSAYMNFYFLFLFKCFSNEKGNQNLIQYNLMIYKKIYFFFCSLSGSLAEASPAQFDPLLFFWNTKCKQTSSLLWRTSLRRLFCWMRIGEVGSLRGCVMCTGVFVCVNLWLCFVWYPEDYNLDTNKLSKINFNKINKSRQLWVFFFCVIFLSSFNSS